MQFNDPDFGTVTVTVNTRARNIIMRAEAGGLRITVPPQATASEIHDAIDRNRNKIKEKVEHATPLIQHYDTKYRIDTDRMQLRIVRSTLNGIYSSTRQGECTLTVGPDIDLDSKENQKWMHDIIVEQLRKQAKVILYNRTIELAHQHGFKPTSIKIQSSQSRWGSCSGRNSINLSLFLMTVPSHLQDYVILHELCHTVHHDHSPAFWALMDKVTDNRAHAYREELKQYNPDV